MGDTNFKQSPDPQRLDRLLEGGVGGINLYRGYYNKKLNVLSGKNKHKCCGDSKKQKISTRKIKKRLHRSGICDGPKR